MIGSEGRAGHPAAQPPRPQRLGRLQRQLPAEPEGQGPGAPHRLQAGTGLGPRARGRVRRRSRLHRGHRRIGRRPLCALMALTANDPAYQPGFEDADTSRSRPPCRSTACTTCWIGTSRPARHVREVPPARRDGHGTARGRRGLGGLLTDRPHHGGRSADVHHPRRQGRAGAGRGGRRSPPRWPRSRPSRSSTPNCRVPSTRSRSSRASARCRPSSTSSASCTTCTPSTWRPSTPTTRSSTGRSTRARTAEPAVIAGS